jgi:hypothetical protein
MREERPATRQGFFSRVFFGNDQRERRRMTTPGFHISQRDVFSKSNLRGRSPP